METDIPLQDTVTGGTTGGLSTGVKVAIVFGVISVCCGGGIIWKFPKLIKAIRSWCQKCKGSREATSGRRHTAVESGVNDDDNVNAPREEGATESEVNLTVLDKNPHCVAEINATTLDDPGEPLLDETALDHSPNQQVEISKLSEGHGDGQAVEDMEIDDRSIHTPSANVALPQQNFYDIYLVSSSKQTPHVEKIKSMCQSNEWIFTTPFNRKLGEPEMQSAEEAVLTCSHIVFVITKEDCTEMSVMNKMIIEMAFEAVNNDIGGRIIPIRCCDKKFLPLRLRCLTGSTIDDDDLENRMMNTIDKSIREQRQVSDVTGVSDHVTGVSDVAGVSDHVTGVSDVANGGDNASSGYSGNAVLTDIYFMDLAKQIGSEWQFLALGLGFTKAEIERIMEEKGKVVFRTLNVLQTWCQRTPIKDDREKVDKLCSALTKCDRVDLSDRVKSNVGFGS